MRTLFLDRLFAAAKLPPVAYGKPRRLLSSTQFQSSSGECRFMGDSVMRGRFIFTVLALALPLLSISSVTKAEQKKYDPEMIAECDRSLTKCKNNLETEQPSR